MILLKFTLANPGITASPQRGAGGEYNAAHEWANAKVFR
jgi:hypothetical protein